MKIAITGHRPNKLGGDYSIFFKDYGALKMWIYRELEATLVGCGLKVGNVESLISGMAIGVDMIFATLALRLEIPLIAAVPFKGQESRWNKETQQFYHIILNHPFTTTHILSEGDFAVWKMHRRNEWMVDNCDLLIAVWDGSEGGTGSCVKYAEKKRKKIIYINPKDFDS